MMWELVCEGHWGLHSMMQQASNRQANKTTPARSSAAKGKKLWIMMGIIHKLFCHKPFTHTHTHTLSAAHSKWILSGPILAISIMGLEWHISNNAAMLKFIKRLKLCPVSITTEMVIDIQSGHFFKCFVFLFVSCVHV